MWPALRKLDKLTFRSLAPPPSPAPARVGKRQVRMTESTPVFAILPIGTKVGRASRGRRQLNDSFWDEEPFAWFTFVERGNADWKEIIDTNLQNYLQEYDENGRKTHFQTKNYYYDTVQELKLYDMSNPQTIQYLENYTSDDNKRVSVEDLNVVFPIVGRRVKRRSVFPRDRRLFQSMIRAGLFDHHIRGWCHDDMEMITGGTHAREGVVVHPFEAFIEQEEIPHNPSNPTTPTK